MNESIQRALQGLATHLEVSFRNQQPPEEYPSELREKTGRYPFIPLDWGSFTDSIEIVVTDIKEKKFQLSEYLFVEFGAGIGLKTLFGYRLFGKALGLEINKKYLNQAKKLYPYSSSGYSPLMFKSRDVTKLTKRDFEWGSSPINPKIVAYFFCPLCDHKKEMIFEKKLEELLPPGSYLVGFYQHDNEIYKDPRFKEVKKGNGHVWYKQ